MKLKQILRALDKKGFTHVDGFRVTRPTWAYEDIYININGKCDALVATVMPNLWEYFTDDWELYKIKTFKNGKIKHNLVEDLETL